MPKGQPISGHTHRDKEPAINKYFNAAIKVSASDLHLKVGMPPKLRIQGSLKNTTGEIMTEEKVEKLVFEILSDEQKEYFLKHGALDFAWQVTENDRFRTNIFRQRGFISLSARHITSKKAQPSHL